MGAGDETSVSGGGDLGVGRVVRGFVAEDEHGAGLVGFAEEGDDFGAWALEVDVADVDVVPEFGVVMEEAVDFGAFGAVPRRARTVFKAVFQEEQDIAFHGWSVPELGGGGKRSGGGPADTSALRSSWEDGWDGCNARRGFRVV